MDRAPARRAALAQLREVLAALFGPGARVVVRERGASALTIEIDAYRFVAVMRASASVAQVADAARVAAALAAEERAPSIPIVVVPHLGEAGRAICRERAIGFVDLSGNASLRAEGLVIHVSGEPSRERRKGRPSNLFAPRSARLVRRWLMLDDRPRTQRSLAREAAIDEGHASRVVARLLEDGFVERTDEGLVRIRDRELLLAAFREARPFARHAIRRGQLVARSGEARTRLVADALGAEGIAHAASGFSAAHAYAGFGPFQLATLYVETLPSEGALALLGFRDEARASNVWLATIEDDGVLDGARDVDGLRCVHPIQARIDLVDHPDRDDQASRVLLRYSAPQHISVSATRPLASRPPKTRTTPVGS